MAIDSPSPRLPTEIWLHIFEMVSRRPSDSLNTNSAPWTLGHICSTWRHLVLSNTSLWSTLIITTEPHFAGQILIEHLRRSAEHPLRIGIQVPLPVIDPNDSDSDDEVQLVVDQLRFRRLIDLLVHESRRWHTVELEVYSFAVTDLDLAARLRGKLPLLEEFYLKKPPYDPLAPDQNLVRTFLQAPNLHKADFRDNRLFEAPSAAHITHLSTTLNVPSDVQYLSSYAHITELHLRSYHRKPVSTPIILPMIKKFSARLSIILDVLTLPNLETLTVRDCSSKSRESLEKFLERSRCQLKVLSILKGQLLAELDLRGPAFRYVNRLTLPVPQNTLETMAKMSDPAVLPSLEVVTLMIKDAQFSEEVESVEEGARELKMELIAFLGKRRMKLLRLYCGDNDFAALQNAGLRELGEAGLAVELDHFNSNHDEWKWWKGPHWFLASPDLRHIASFLS
ncbi:hypothetical protein CPB85DRAFT_1304372 [Mucidula mucida]|nr:hypothetical protein CPB85DRAFT_1304372 [Mucidula mucida]